MTPELARMAERCRLAIRVKYYPETDDSGDMFKIGYLSWAWLACTEEGATAAYLQLAANLERQRA